MFTRSSWLHLRFPFSWFLLPVFLFSLCVSPNIDVPRIGWVFLIVHFLLYPASNGYNSYFDKDENSIGGLKNPPPVKRGLYHLAIFLDIIALVLGYLTVNFTFAFMLLIYGLVSKAYSHPSVRIKKYAVTGWLIAGLIQGLFTFLMCYCGLNDFALQAALNPKVVFAAGLTSLMLWANYPMTQVYQHDEDSRRGDHTLSIVLGITRTFYFSGIFFALAAIAFAFYLTYYFKGVHAVVFLGVLSPVLVYFVHWLLRVRKQESAATYEKTMLLNMLSATSLNAFFVYLFLESSHVLQIL